VSINIKPPEKIVSEMDAGSPLVPADTEPDKPDTSDNQCDGCAQGLKVVNGIHRTADDRAFMVCSKDKYNVHIVESMGWLINYADGRKEVIIGALTDETILLEGDEALPAKFTHKPLYTLDQAMPLCVERIMTCEGLKTNFYRVREHDGSWCPLTTTEVLALLNSKENNGE